MDENVTWWIVNDRGFGGVFYTCDNCGKIYCNLFEDPGLWDTCPNCGLIIDDDRNVYLD